MECVNGNHWNMNAPKIVDAIKLIDCQTRGFKKYLIEVKPKKQCVEPKPQKKKTVSKKIKK